MHRHAAMCSRDSPPQSPASPSAESSFTTMISHCRPSSNPALRLPDQRRQARLQHALFIARRHDHRQRKLIRHSFHLGDKLVRVHDFVL